jgi:tetratricopeptide (TPR) repeat protein
MAYSEDMRRSVWGFASLLPLLWMAALLAQNHQPGSNGTFQTTSLLGRRLYALPDDDGSVRAARQALAADPRNTALVLRLSKAQAAKRQYREATATCTDGLRFAPDNAELYLERGHRELGLRDFQAALADLQRAVQINPKQLDAQYHLGMAYYFLRDFTEAARFFGQALELAQTADSVIDCSNWRYVSLRRAGDEETATRVLARITPEIKNKEPHLFFYLQLLHFYQGALPEGNVLPRKPTEPSDIEGELSFNTVNYGIGNWHLYNDHDPAGARELFRRVVTGSAWNSWGFIGSELELRQNSR